MAVTLKWQRQPWPPATSGPRCPGELPALWLGWGAGRALSSLPNSSGFQTLKTFMPFLLPPRERHQREDSMCLPRDWEAHSAYGIPLLVRVLLGRAQQCLPAGWRYGWLKGAGGRGVTIWFRPWPLSKPFPTASETWEPPDILSHLTEEKTEACRRLWPAAVAEARRQAFSPFVCVHKSRTGSCLM